MPCGPGGLRTCIRHRAANAACVTRVADEARPTAEPLRVSAWARDRPLVRAPPATFARSYGR